jgi:O-antigen/teichoic acid export membrane protein
MKLQIRILLYSLLFFTFSFSTSLLLALGEKLKDHRFITLGCGFFVINIIFSLFVLKWNALLSIICSIAIAALSLFLALRFGDLHLFTKYDEYGIKTALMANAIFPIIFWEIVYQVKARKE